MKHFDRLHDSELKLIDRINKMSSQLHFVKRESESNMGLELYLEDLDSVEDQLESVRIRLEPSSRRKRR